MSDSGLLTLGICCSDIDYGRSHAPLSPPPALTIWLQTRYTNQLIRVGEESKVTVDRYDFDESFVRVRLLCGGAPTSSFDSSLYSLSSTSLPVSSSSKIKEPQTSPTAVSKKNQRRKQRRTSLVRAQSSVAATPSPPLSRNGPASDKVRRCERCVNSSSHQEIPLLTDSPRENANPRALVHSLVAAPQATRFHPP